MGGASRLRSIVKALVIFAALFVVSGLLLNWVFHRVSYSFFINAKPNTEVDERIVELDMGDGASSLVGYARSNDYTAPHPAIIYFGGSGDIAYNAVLGKADLFDDYVFMSVDYPGTQKSAGKMSLESMQSAALRIYDYAVDLSYVDQDHIYVMGASYGTGMATYLASERQCAKLVLVAPYRDAKDMFPIFKSPFGWFLTDNIDTKQYAQAVDAPILIVTSDADETIDKSVCYSLSEYFANARVFEVKGVDHNSLIRSDEIITEIHRFLRE